ncbi:MAG: phosphatase PAP2 family protein [Candidatus Nanoarchaeia archaeon]|nr:phosphatase PAP2 family protein [Candidatus Nanoarchaeia archaeon]
MINQKKVILGIFLTIILLGIVFYFDNAIVNAVELLRNPYLDEFFLGITFVSSEIIIAFLLTSLFLWKEHKRKWILPLWLTLGITAVVSFVLKFLIQRARPFQSGLVSLLPALQSASYAIWNFSFPSFQAALGFCAIPVLSKEFPKLKYFWIGFAVLIAFSRLYFGLHFLSDVIFGGLIGYLAGFVIVKAENRTKFFERIYKKVFKRK